MSRVAGVSCWQSAPKAPGSAGGVVGIEYGVPRPSDLRTFDFKRNPRRRQAKNGYGAGENMKTET